MSEHRTRLLGVVEALARREQQLLRRGTALRAILLAALSVAAVAGFARLDVPRPVAVTWLVLLVGLGSLGLVVAPWWLGRRQAADVLRQARLLEAREPGLRGRLITVVGHREGVRGAESPALLDLAARRALPEAERHAPEAIHPGREQRWLVGAAAFALLLAAGAWWASPGGGAGVVQWWAGSSGAAGVGADDAELALASARVGDLTLRYVYPDYTGLEPYEVVNSTGEAHAPPGTRVEVLARSADVVDGAALRAYDGPTTDAQVRDGRWVSASFLVRPEAGAWRLVTSSGGTTRTSKAFPIVPEPDAAPQVSLLADDDVVEVGVDDPIGLGWSAQDDYGLTRVFVAVEGREPRLLRVLLDRQRTAEDRIDLRPSDLGLVEGDDVELRVVAWDNDAVSGSKAGRSNAARVVVLGEDGVATLDRALAEELLGLSLDALAAFFEETFPPGTTAGRLASWGEAVNARYQPLATLVDTRKSRRVAGADWAPVEDALDAGRTLVRFTQTAFLPGSQERVATASVEAVDGFRVDATTALEDAILHLDALLRRDAFDTLVEQTESLQERARALEAFLARAQASPAELTVQREITRELVERVAAAAQGLADGGLKDFVTTRMDEADALLDEVGKAAGAGRTEEALDLAERLQDRLDETFEGIQEELARMQEDLGRRKSDAQSLVDELEAIAGLQDELSARLAEARAREGAAQRDELADVWRRVEAQAQAVTELVARFDDDLAASGRAFNEVAFVQEARDRADLVRAAARARDASGAYRGAVDLDAHWGRYAERRARLAERGLSTGEPGAARIGQVTQAIGTLLDLLEQLRRRDEAADPALREAARQLQSEQAALERRLQDARADAKRVAQEMPVTPRDLEPALQSASERMEEAAEGLGRGEPMQAQGSQEAASQHVRDAIEALKQASQSSQSQQPGQGKGKAQGSEKKDGEEGAGAEEREDGPPGERSMDLPEPEEFRTPEAYRRALLQGMEGEVPEAYRALKRRYYEELVHQ